MMVMLRGCPVCAMLFSCFFEFLVRFVGFCGHRCGTLFGMLKCFSLKLHLH
ncbi:hypothetical protein HanRHA438_Chr09g0375931 [Helianthus annuus]|nr:hypothetical protein HanRHA438_Chr09g0375931 [Helianthus annuus]